jgi:hypothetical protein
VGKFQFRVQSFEFRVKKQKAVSSAATHLPDLEAFQVGVSSKHKRAVIEAAR